MFFQFTGDHHVGPQPPTVDVVWGIRYDIAHDPVESLSTYHVFRVLHACGRGRVHRISISVVFWDTSISSAKRRA